MEQLNEPQISYPLPSNATIFASNVSLKATESSLREFFGICGEIKSISLQKTTEGEKQFQTAIIVFESDEAAKTALFLNDTFIIDSAIKVSPYTGDLSSDKPQSDQSSESNAQSNAQQPAQDPGMLVNLLASAYMLGAKAWQSVVEFDSKNKISSTIQEKAVAVDTQYKLSEKSSNATKKFTEVANEVDKSLKITENSNKLAEKTNASFVAIKTRNEQTEKFFDSLNVLGQKITTTIEEAVKVGQQKIDLVRSEIKRREEEEKKQQTDNSDPNSNPNPNDNSNLGTEEPTVQVTSESAPLLENNNSNN
jgi:hypothetical protein